MNIFYASKLDVGSDEYKMDDSEWHHCHKVMRLGMNDAIHFFTGDGTLRYGKIVSANKNFGTVSMTEIIRQEPYPTRKGIAIAPTKNMSRIEWMVEKGVEIGVTDFIFFQSQHSERTHLKQDRLQKILLSAVKQSLKLFLPSILVDLSFEEVLYLDGFDAKYIAHCKEDTVPILSVLEGQKPNLVLIGPEGDFSNEEINLARKNGLVSVSLGNTRLRTETAGLMAGHFMVIANEYNFNSNEQ